MKELYVLARAADALYAPPAPTRVSGVIAPLGSGGLPALLASHTREATWNGLGTTSFFGPP